MTITFLCRISFGMMVFALYSLWVTIAIDSGYWPVAVLMFPWLPPTLFLADKSFVEVFGDGQ